MKEQDVAHSSPISERYETNDDVRLNILINHLERVAAEWPYSNRIFQDREAALRAMKFYAEHELTRLRSELQQKDEAVLELSEILVIAYDALSVVRTEPTMSGSVLASFDKNKFIKIRGDFFEFLDKHKTLESLIKKAKLNN